MDIPSSSPHSLEAWLDVQDMDLDERIHLAELALIARDEKVTGLVSGLGQRVRRARRPSRWMPPVVGGVALVLAGWWLWRRFRPAVAPRKHRSAEAADREGGRAPRARLGLLEGLALAWPLLPDSWRARWGPTSTSALFNLGSGLVRQFFRAGTPSSRSAPPSAPPMPAGSVPAAPAGPTVPPLRTVAHVDLARYAGTWHEIARLPAPFEQACDGQPQAHYTLSDGNGIAVINRCRGVDGRDRLSHGEARVVAGSNGARLKVSFLPNWLRWLPVGWADYWVLYLDEGYTVALVGEPKRHALWVLARRPRIDTETLHQLVGLARAQGFPVERLVIH